MRALVRETHLHPGALIAPMFLCPGEGIRREISSMPGVFNLSIDEAVKEAEAASLGLGGLLLFGLPEHKDEQATGAWADDGIVQRGIQALKQVELAQKSGDHRRRLPLRIHLPRPLRHRQENRRRITRSRTIPAWNFLPRQPLRWRKQEPISSRPRHDGWPRSRHPRRPRRRRAGERARSCRYASKFASAFYGPFREAADSAPQFGDRRSYQMDGANIREAMREIELDIGEGADMILMKPAMPYLDVIRAARENFDVPMGAYQVSGEYSMLQAAFQRGWLEPQRAMLESLLSIRRAGADFIVTYFAQEAAKGAGLNGWHHSGA